MGADRWLRGVVEGRSEALGGLVAPADPSDRSSHRLGTAGTARVALLVVGLGAPAAKSWATWQGRWTGEVPIQVAVAIVPTMVAAVVLAAGRGGIRPGRARRALGLGDLPAHPGRWSPWAIALATAGPLAAAAIVIAVPGSLHSVPVPLTAGDVFDAVVGVALAEELVYRGAILSLAHRALPAWWAEVITALLFGACHVGNVLGAADRPTGTALAVALAGNVLGPAIAGLMVFAWLRHGTRSLAGPVAAHAANSLLRFA